MELLAGYLSVLCILIANGGKSRWMGGGVSCHKWDSAGDALEKGGGRGSGVASDDV